MEQSDEIINQIQKIRAKNNSLWMEILRIAMKYGADETRSVFKEIIHNDEQITELSRKLSND